MADYSGAYDPPAHVMRERQLEQEVKQLKKELQEIRDRELAQELGETDFTKSDLAGHIECLICGSIVNVNRRSKHRERCLK